MPLMQLKSFLGLLNYYGKFIPNLSTLLAPLHRLLRKQSTWTWGSEQQGAFDRVRGILTSDSVLVHYDPSKPLLLACDASPYGVGAVLSHKLADGSERPVAYASRSLGPAEKKYSQLDKEGLAIIFGVKQFHQYIVGRHFTILSDHKPLQHLFQETTGVPVLASGASRGGLSLSVRTTTLSGTSLASTTQILMFSADSLSLTIPAMSLHQVRPYWPSTCWSLFQ